MTSFIKHPTQSDELKPVAAAASLGDASVRPLSSVPEGHLSYQEAKRYARDADPLVRSALARRTDVPPEILYFLADDPDDSVRRAIVHNHATPALAHLVLVDDSSADVRADLAERIVRLAPGLTADERDRARQTAYRVLERLVRDQLPRIRAVIAEALKDVADAPPEIIQRLARDVEETVASPILEFSPVLRDEDLLDIIDDNPSTAALSAISRRRSVGPNVVDAIAATDDSGAIAILLANDSAQIREETLDMLIDRASSHPDWHEPMVRRPQLHKEAAARLAHFVADRLIQVLIGRKDLSEETLSEVKRVVHRRLSSEDNEEDITTAAPAPASPPLEHDTDEIPMESPGPSGITLVPIAAHDTRGWSHGLRNAYDRAYEMARNGTLTSTALSDAIKSNNTDFVIAGLAIKAQLSPLLIQIIIRSGSGHGIAAIVWKGHLDPSLSIQVQSRLGRIPPREIVMPNGELGYGISEAEMDWQLEMFAKLARERSC